MAHADLEHAHGAAAEHGKAEVEQQPLRYRVPDFFVVFLRFQPREHEGCCDRQSEDSAGDGQQLLKVLVGKAHQHKPVTEHPMSEPGTGDGVYSGHHAAEPGKGQEAGGLVHHFADVFQLLEVICLLHKKNFELKSKRKVLDDVVGEGTFFEASSDLDLL